MELSLKKKNSSDKKNQKELRLRKGHVPVKRTINFAAVTETEKINIPLAIIGSALIIAGACFFSKTAVVDRLVRINEVNSQIQTLTKQLDQVNQDIDGYGDIMDSYAHYSYAGMHDDERYRTDRMDVVSLLEKVVYPKAYVSSWGLSGNVVSLPLTAKTLGEVNQIIQELQAEDIVEYCTVSTAQTDVLRDEMEEMVTAQITIFLIPEDITQKGADK